MDFLSSMGDGLKSFELSMVRDVGRVACKKSGKVLKETVFGWVKTGNRGRREMMDWVRTQGVEKQTNQARRLECDAWQQA